MGGVLLKGGRGRWGGEEASLGDKGRLGGTESREKHNYCKETWMQNGIVGGKGR